jgi:hypothetical protein
MSHILPDERCGITKFGCNLAALWLEHIANDDPRSFCDEQPSLSCALSACSSTDKYDFASQAIHLVLHLLADVGISEMSIMRLLRRLGERHPSAARRASRRFHHGSTVRRH